MRDWLISLRKERGFSQKYVSEQIHIAQPSYCTIESGKTTPSVETAKAIGKVLGFDWKRFYEDSAEAVCLTIHGDRNLADLVDIASVNALLYADLAGVIGDCEQYSPNGKDTRVANACRVLSRLLAEQSEILDRIFDALH